MIDVTEASVPQFGRGVRLRHTAQDDAWVLLAPEKMFELDQISAEILRRIDGEKSVSAIVDDLCRTFDADRSEVLEDVRAFIADFAMKRVLEL